jgi:hypothetical protein
VAPHGRYAKEDRNPERKVTHKIWSFGRLSSLLDNRDIGIGILRQGAAINPDQLEVRPNFIGQVEPRAGIFGSVEVVQAGQYGRPTQSEQSRCWSRLGDS